MLKRGVCVPLPSAAIDDHDGVVELAGEVLQHFDPRGRRRSGRREGTGIVRFEASTRSHRQRRVLRQ